MSIKEYDFTLSDNIEDISPTKEYAYDSTYPDRLTNFNGSAIYYNSMGYPIEYGGRSYIWNKGKLSRIYRGSPTQGGATYEDCVFTYDAYGRRLSKSYTYDPNPASTSDYSYTYNTTYNYDNSGRLVREYCTERYVTGTTNKREFIYLYDESGMIGVLYSYNGSSLTPYYYHRNLQGDVIGIYDANGTQIVKYSYDAWGNCTVAASSVFDLANNNPIRYRGYYYDRETKLYYLNARYYNPEWLRFISPDSTEYIDSENPNGLNLYAYCNNDPVNYSDPSGHKLKKLQESINEWFGSFVEYSKTVVEKSIDLLFIGYESGIKKTHVRGNDNAPFSFFRTIPENWWEFWKYHKGVKINIHNFSLSIGLGLMESTLSFSVNNSSLDFTVGIDKIAIARSQSTDNATWYEQYYIRPIPILIAYVIIVYVWPFLLTSGGVPIPV